VSVEAAGGARMPERCEKKRIDAEWRTLMKQPEIARVLQIDSHRLQGPPCGHDFQYLTAADVPKPVSLACVAAVCAIHRYFTSLTLLHLTVVTLSCR
jgi:hypothetical protein